MKTISAAMALVGLATTCGCGDRSTTLASSAPSASVYASAPAPLASDGRKMGTAKQSFERANAIYKETFDLKSTASLTAKLEAMRSKLGPPDKTVGDKSYWYAVDAEGHCFEFTASATDGAGFTAVDQGRCGL